MYVDQLYIYGEGNIVSFNECITYYYQIKPINSLYASDSQLQTLIQNLHEKILNINMPGEILILPARINKKEILTYHEKMYKVHRRKELDVLEKNFIKDLEKQTSEKVKYRYKIYLAFCDNREPLKSKLTMNLLRRDNDPLDERMKNLCGVVDEHIYKKLSSDLTCTRLSKDDTERLHNYIALPVEGKIAEYYTTPQATGLQYDYKYSKQTNFQTLYTRTLIAQKFKELRLQDGYHANTAINELQLGTFPVDTIIKFELEHTASFKRNMSGKREDIRKSAKRYYNMSDKKDKDAQKALELAKIGENVDPSIEDSKIRWQLMLRVRANEDDMLTKRCDNIMKKFEGKGIELTYAIGEQEKLANNLFPFKSAYHHCLNLTDVLYFAHFNFFGGLYIGEEDKGIVLTYTKPADLPVRIDIEAPIKGNARNASSTTVVAGETGSGKSQLANHITMLSMIFYGHKVLAIDPKGDRFKLVEQLNKYGAIASHLVIGDQKCPNGMFDAFLLHADDQVQALATAKNDIVALVRAVNKDQHVDLLNVDRAYEKMCLAKENGTIKQLTMGHLVDYLMEFDVKTASNVKSLRLDPMARLFYGDDESDISQVFKLSHPYNLVTFAKMPVYSDSNDKVVYDDENLDHKVFALILSKVLDITNMFLRQNKGKAKTLLFDECKLFATIPGGTAILINNNLIARSELCNILYLLQNWSDLPNSIVNNTGQYFIGNMKSKQEIALILDHFDLGNNAALSSVLQDRTKNEGVRENQKYNFLYCDYNNRKCITKIKFPDLFADAFRTFKDDDTPKMQKIEITNGDHTYEKK